MPTPLIYDLHENDWISTFLTACGQTHQWTNRAIDLPCMTAIDSVAWRHMPMQHWVHDRCMRHTNRTLGELLGNSRICVEWRGLERVVIGRLGFE